MSNDKTLSILSRVKSCAIYAFWALLLLLCSVYSVYWINFTGGYGFQMEWGKPAIVSWTGKGRTVHYIDGADPSTFHTLNEYGRGKILYAADANRVYIGLYSQALQIESADSNSFSLLTNDGAYATDQGHVYWYGVELADADPATFRVLRGPYAVDANWAYVGRIPLDVHSLKDFEVLSVHGFERPIKIRNSRLIIKDTSEQYVSGWSRDGTAYYWGAMELTGADYDSLVILNAWHAKDKKRVYYRGKPIPGADAESFVTIEPRVTEGRDKDFVYEEGKPIKRIR